MEKKLKTYTTKVENKGVKKKVNPFKVSDNYYSSKKLSVYDFNDKPNNNKKQQSDRKLIKINFLEKRKSVKETKKGKNINENNNKLKKSIMNANTIQIPCIKIENIHKWKEILYNHNRIFSITQLNENKYNNEDEKILNQNYIKENKIKDSKEDEDDVDIVTKDVVRTRVSETKLIKDYNKNLESLIRFFIKENNVKYKQGLNEIVGAFLILKYTNIKEDMTLSEIYNLLNGFINLFVFNYYYEESFYSIKNSFSLLSLLIKYHSPEIFNIFDKAMIYPEMYATSWILTTFAYKLKLNILFYLWNKLILENDPLMLHYLIVGLILYKKNSFIDSDIGSIPIIINKINIESQEDVDNIFTLAINLRKKTPYSFRLFAGKLDILKHKSINHKSKYNLYHPDTLITLPIFPSEIFYICYKDIIKCPDETHFKNISIKGNCEHCDMKIEKDINYILFDLRILEKGKFESNNEKTGFLPQMIMIEQKEFKDNNFLDIINNRFNDVKNKYHFIFMTSNTDCLNLTNPETNNFEDSQNEKSNDDQRNSNSIKIIHLDKISKKMTHYEKNNKKEYDNLKRLLLYLIKNNYQYISYIYGGFETIHNEIMNNKKNMLYSELYLLNHNDDKCGICKNNKKIFKALSPKYSKISLKKTTGLLKSSSPKKTFFISKLLKNKSVNKTEPNETKSEMRDISLDEVNEMISNTKYFTGPCRFVSSENNNLENKDDDNQGLLVIYNNKLFVIKTPIYKSKSMQIIHEIPTNNIKDVKIKSKLFVHINFIKNTLNNGKKNEKNTVKAKFNYEIDCQKIVDAINKAKKNKK